MRHVLAARSFVNISGGSGILTPRDITPVSLGDVG
jgi:hypothetical protein